VRLLRTHTILLTLGVCVIAALFTGCQSDPKSYVVRSQVRFVDARSPVHITAQAARGQLHVRNVGDSAFKWEIIGASSSESARGSVVPSKSTSFAVDRSSTIRITVDSKAGTALDVRLVSSDPLYTLTTTVQPLTPSPDDNPER